MMTSAHKQKKIRFINNEGLDLQGFREMQKQNEGGCCGSLYLLKCLDVHMYIIRLSYMNNGGSVCFIEGASFYGSICTYGSFFLVCLQVEARFQEENKDNKNIESFL